MERKAINYEFYRLVQKHDDQVSPLETSNGNPNLFVLSLRMPIHPSPFIHGSSPLVVLAVLAVPFMWMVVVFTALVLRKKHPQAAAPWRLAEGVAVCAIGVALAFCATLGMGGAAQHVPAEAYWLPGVRLDTLSALLLMMVAFLGWVIVRFSRRYLDGDPGRMRYLIFLCATLAAVWCLLASNNLLLVCLAWSLSSLCLHPLLTFYRERPAAMLAAHKKFLVSRVADAFSLVGCGFLYSGLGTLKFDQLAHQLAQPLPALAGTQVAVAGTLFAAAAILKCAQLPFHGWLLQVMEAPTPVSALLHAGIVNIGGFVLLRLAGVLDHAPYAQLLLVTSGSMTAATAALVMMTRISAKVMLAWSTVAQMGFMLLEIGLGAYALALLHLVAHSMYKAHAFLSAGDSARVQHNLRIAPAGQPMAVTARVMVAVGLPLGIGSAAWVCGVDLRDEPSSWVLAAALASGLWPLVRACRPTAAPQQTALLAACAFGLSLLYFGWHRLFDHLAPAQTTAPSAILAGFAAGCLLALLAVQETVLARPDGALSRWLHPRAFAGFHLDESFTRLTWAVWPAPGARDRLPSGSPPRAAIGASTAPKELS